MSAPGAKRCRVLRILRISRPRCIRPMWRANRVSSAPCGPGGVEEGFGWIKTVAGQEQTKFRGRERVGWAFTFATAAYNLVRLPKLMAAPT